MHSRLTPGESRDDRGRPPEKPTDPFGFTSPRAGHLPAAPLERWDPAAVEQIQAFLRDATLELIVHGNHAGQPQNTCRVRQMQDTHFIAESGPNSNPLSLGTLVPFCTEHSFPSPAVKVGDLITVAVLGKTLSVTVEAPPKPGLTPA